MNDLFRDEGEWTSDRPRSSARAPRADGRASSTPLASSLPNAASAPRASGRSPVPPTAPPRHIHSLYANRVEVLLAVFAGAADRELDVVSEAVDACSSPDQVVDAVVDVFVSRAVAGRGLAHALLLEDVPDAVRRANAAPCAVATSPLSSPPFDALWAGTTLPRCSPAPHRGHQREPRRSPRPGTGPTEPGRSAVAHRNDRVLLAGRSDRPAPRQCPAHPRPRRRLTSPLFEY
ncbi:hypothetical protein IOD13_12455 [Brevibacterium casei]|nr:hypothetical protein [Brevibacterium casei]